MSVQHLSRKPRRVLKKVQRKHFCKATAAIIIAGYDLAKQAGQMATYLYEHLQKKCCQHSMLFKALELQSGEAGEQL